ncbi:hypothetical protein Q9189_006827 [Teloschistes chrysophthalmus]
MDLPNIQTGLPNGIILCHIQPVPIRRNQHPGITESFVGLVPVMKLPAESTVPNPRDRLERHILKDRGKSSLYGNPYGIIRTDGGENQGKMQPRSLLVVGEEAECSPKNPYQRDGNQQQIEVGHNDQELNVANAILEKQ